MVCTRLRLGVPVALIAFDRLLRAGISKKESRSPPCHERRNATSSSRVRRHMRAATVLSCESVEQAADAEGHACRERSLFASRLGTARVQPGPEGMGPDTHRWSAAGDRRRWRADANRDFDRQSRVFTFTAFLQPREISGVRIACAVRAENKGDVRIHGQIPRSSSQKTAVHEFCEWKSHLNGVQNSRGMLAS